MAYGTAASSDLVQAQTVSEEAGSAIVRVAPIEMVGVATKAVANVGDRCIEWGRHAQQSHGENCEDDVHDVIGRRHGDRDQVVFAEVGVDDMEYGLWRLVQRLVRSRENSVEQVLVMNVDCLKMSRDHFYSYREMKSIAACRGSTKVSLSYAARVTPCGK